MQKPEERALTELERQYVIGAIRAAMEGERKYFSSEKYQALESALAKLEGRPTFTAP